MYLSCVSTHKAAFYPNGGQASASVIFYLRRCMTQAHS